jgi:excisionase family DNA binding protein
MEVSPVGTTDEFLTVPEAATLLKASRSTVDRLIKRGELSSLKAGRLRRIRRRDLEAWAGTAGAIDPQ